MQKFKGLKRTLAGACALLCCFPTMAKDANNPIDPAPTLGVWNRFYADDFSRLQLLGNMTYGKWFYRVTAEQQINYGESDQFKGGNFMVARLFELGGGKHQVGFGGIVSHIKDRGNAAGLSAVSVSKLEDGWKFITLTTVQAGDDIFQAEFQPGIYKDFEDGWYFRSHPRMLFDFETSQYEVPIGAGFGRVVQSGTTSVNLFFEPQYDVRQSRWMLYTGFKLLF